MDMISFAFRSLLVQVIISLLISNLYSDFSLNTADLNIFNEQIITEEDLPSAFNEGGNTFSSWIAVDYFLNIPYYLSKVFSFIASFGLSYLKLSYYASQVGGVFGIVLGMIVFVWQVITLYLIARFVLGKRL